MGGVPVSIPLHSATNFEIAATKQKALVQGLVIGVFIGTVGGTELTYVSSGSSVSPFIGAIAGGVAGGLIGSLIGSMIKINKWERINLKGFSSFGYSLPEDHMKSKLTLSLTFN